MQIPSNFYTDFKLTAVFGRFIESGSVFQSTVPYTVNELVSYFTVPVFGNWVIRSLTLRL